MGPYALFVQRVARKDHSFAGRIETHVSGRMSGRVEYRQRDVADVNDLTITQLNVRFGGRRNHYTPQIGSPARPKERHIKGMDSQLGTRGGDHIRVCR